MHAILAAIVSLTAVATASPLLQGRAGTTANGTTVYSINYDKYVVLHLFIFMSLACLLTYPPKKKKKRSCYYPTSDATFDLATYAGVWYQVAGYAAIFTAGCKCITANYTLNDDGTVHVVNECQALGLPVSIEGTAAAADAAYGDAGVFRVTLGGIAPTCPGPNYIVQGTSFPLPPPP